MVKQLIFALLYLSSISKLTHKKVQSQSKRPYGLNPPEEESAVTHSISSKIYEFCRKIVDCNMCAGSFHCGWCASSNVCMPTAKRQNGNNIRLDQCNKDAFVTTPNQCSTQKFHFGQFTNIAHDANNFVNAQIANPNIIVKITDDANGLSSFKVPLNKADQSFGFHGI